MSKRKRIILITNAFPFGLGEASFILPELTYLHERMDITIVSRNYTDEMTSIIDIDIDVFRYNAKDVRFHDLWRYIPCLFDLGVFKEVLHNAKSFKHIMQTVKMVLRGAHFAYYVNGIRQKYNQEVIYYTYWNDYATYGVAKHCRKKGNLVVSRIHGGDLYLRPTNGYCLPLKCEIARMVDRIIFISEQGKMYFYNTYCSQYASKYVVYRMGTANEKSVSRASGDGILRIVSVSNVVFGKRVSCIPDALALIKDLKIEWTHFGDGDEMNHVLESVKKVGCNVSCNIMGRVSNKDILQYYSENAVDLFINVSYSEGLPVSMMEAASFGIPIIGTDVGAVNEIVTAGNGYLLNKNFSSEQLTQLLYNYMRLSDDEKQSLRKVSREIWSERFDASNNYSRFSEMICNL